MEVKEDTLRVMSLNMSETTAVEKRMKFTRESVEGKMDVYRTNETHLMGEDKWAGEESGTWCVSGIGEDAAQSEGIYHMVNDNGIDRKVIDRLKR